MNEPERTELARLKDQQARLEHELRLLSRQLSAFEQRVIQSSRMEARAPEAVQPAPGIPPAERSAPAVARPKNLAIGLGGQIGVVGRTITERQRLEPLAVFNDRGPIIRAA